LEFRRSFRAFYPRNIKFNKKKKQIKFKYKNCFLRFYFLEIKNAIQIFKEQFIDEQYKWLNVKGKEVVDIGANIGDSAIYFAVNTALE
jgi:hypothetical protein